MCLPLVLKLIEVTLRQMGDSASVSEAKPIGVRRQPLALAVSVRLSSVRRCPQSGIDPATLLNLELAKKPLECLEYVLVHELVHLLERHHNARFKAYTDKYLPQWQRYHDILKREPLGNENWVC